MSELLTNSKRKYIENWRLAVCQHMESGTICRVTISEMTPEPSGYIGGYIKPSNEHVKAMAARSPPLSTENTSNNHLPAVKFGYSHGNEEIKTHQKLRNHKRHEVSRTLLPPSPNGMLVQNGGPETNIHMDKKSNALKSIENNICVDKELGDITVSKETRESGKRSSQIAKEIYDKYNMKSRAQNVNGVSQYSMPWRNKTFLTLPVRFNDSARRKQMKYLVRERTSLSSRKETLSSSMLTNESRHNFHDWEGEVS